MKKRMDWSKMKAFADYNLNVNQNLKFALVDNIVEKVKEKMLVTTIFSFSHNVFLRLLCGGALKVGILW